MADLSLDTLEAVLAVARRGTFRAAAIDCGVSTTALSHQIARLETSLGVRLFHRTTRSVSLTDAGRLFVDEVGPALQGVRDGVEAVRARSRSPSGTIRINAAVPAAHELFSPLVLDYLAQYPNMHVDLVTEGRLIDIVAEGFDLGVRAAHLVPSDMISVSLGRPQHHVVVASPAYLKKHVPPGTPTDLHGHDCIRIRLPDRSLYNWHFERDGETIRIDVPGRLTLDEGELARSAALAGTGIAYLHEFNVRADITEGRLVTLLDAWMPARSDLCLYYPGRRHTSAGLSAFIALARSHARATRLNHASEISEGEVRNG
jgi:DNA-binding transcriptional LysR family regulator